MPEKKFGFLPHLKNDEPRSKVREAHQMPAVEIKMSESNYLDVLEMLGSGVPELEWDEDGEGGEYVAYVVVHPLPRYRRRNSTGGHNA